MKLYFFTNLNNLINKTSEFGLRLNANSSLSTSDWNSLQLTTLRDSVSNLDYSHPVRNFIEQKLLDGIDTRLKGLEKRILRDPYNPFPKISRSENFPNEFVYVGGQEILLMIAPLHQNSNTVYSHVQELFTQNPTAHSLSNHYLKHEVVN